MFKNLSYNKNLTLNIVFFLLITFFSILFSLNKTEGNFTYALDDAYIHLSIAKNFVEKGIWSVDGYTISSASSSPLWNFLLSPFYLILGEKLFEFVPFFLNVLFQILSISLVYKTIKKFCGKNLHFLVGILLVLITPFFALSMGGMEHSLQIYLILLLIYFFLDYSNNPNNSKIKTQLLIISPFVVFVRYEDFAIVSSMLFFILIYFRDWKFFIKLFLSSLILVLCFGLWTKYYLNLGFIPNSIVAKSTIENDFNILHLIKKTIFHLFENLKKTYLLTLYIIIIIIGVKSYFEKKKDVFVLSSVFILTFIAHLSFARVGWLYRYEAYLILIGFLTIIIWVYQSNAKEFKISIFILIAILPLYGQRVLFSEYQSITASKNIYEQQYQMAEFLKKECNDCSIAANDIGAITYFTNIKLLDLYGLANEEVMRNKKNGTFNNDVVNQLLDKHKVSIIIIYDSWFENNVFEKHTKIGSWQIYNNQICGDDKVSFYSIKEQRNYNYKKLKSFSTNQLPKDVDYKFN